MSEQDCFKAALSNFTHDVASGGAIRHLADLGYSVSQITQKLDFPTPYERVRKTVWEHLLDTGVILLEEPGSAARQERFTYVRDYDRYGRTSFRRVPVTNGKEGTIAWRELTLQNAGHGTFGDYLEKKCAQNGEENAYISCDFGLKSIKEADRMTESLQALKEYQRDYILGLPWENRRCYHRLNSRMREIVTGLYENGGYHGYCYFMKTQEKVLV